MQAFFELTDKIVRLPYQLGKTHFDTSAFAVQTMWRWWFGMGRARYPQAKQLLITTDVGGSNGHRVRLPPGTRQVEYDRAPFIFVYHYELARIPANQS